MVCASRKRAREEGTRKERVRGAGRGKRQGQREGDRRGGGGKRELEDLKHTMAMVTDVVCASRNVDVSNVPFRTRIGASVMLCKNS